MPFSPTPQQLAIIEAATLSQDNLIIEALAGAAKTSTLELIAKALPSVNILSLAFNKKISDEMKLKLPKNCTCMTLNSLGHRAWSDTIGKRLNLKTTKCFDLLKDEIEKLGADERTAAWDSTAFILQSIQWAKSMGHVPNSILKKNERLYDDHDLYESLEEVPSELEWQLILTVLDRSCAQALDGLVDFGDQLLMPTVFKSILPIFTCILVDESQDLSPLNHQMLRKLYRRRLIAVGDACQAIYAFRGAHQDGMTALRKQFDMTPLSLSVSFRCPEAIVDHVRWRAPHMESWSGNPSRGEIIRLHSWDVSELPDDCAVICRNNAPLFGIAIRLLKSGRYPNLSGQDIGRNLIKVMEKLGPASMRIDAAFSALADYQTAQEKKVKNKNALRDKIDCIKIFFDQASNLGAAIQYAEHILRSSGRVHFMTGHKSKGLEFDNVFFLDDFLLGKEGQELNLRYVISTRAKQTLTYINSTDLEQPE